MIHYAIMSAYERVARFNLTVAAITVRSAETSPKRSLSGESVPRDRGKPEGRIQTLKLSVGLVAGT